MERKYNGRNVMLAIAISLTIVDALTATEYVALTSGPTTLLWVPLISNSNDWMASSTTAERFPLEIKNKSDEYAMRNGRKMMLIEGSV